jgi:hypothetical protein
MSPHEHVHTKQELLSLAESEARDLLGVSWQAATGMLDAGALTGSIAEAEIRMLRALIEG